MAEALGTAGSVVGLISLSISCCEGLTKYYSDYRSHSDEVNHMIANIDELKIICQNVQIELQGRINPQERATQQAVRLIDTCLENVRKLDDALVKCRATTLPQDLTAKIMAFRAKALYPFRKRTLQTLIRAVDDVHKNLGSALQMLQL